MERSPETTAGHARTSSSSSLGREYRAEETEKQEGIFEWKQPVRRPPAPPQAAAGVEVRRSSDGHVDTGSFVESEMVVSDGEEGDETPKTVRFETPTITSERYFY